MTSAAFWDRIAEKYAKDAVADEAAYAYTLERTISYLRPEHRVLELGAGTGATAVLIAPHVRHMTATDLSPAMIAIAERRKSEAGLENLHLEAMPVRRALEQVAEVDAILAFNLFHLVPDMERDFAAIAARLPVGGMFISKTACLADPAQGLLRFALPLMLPAMQALGKAPFVRRFTQDHLETAIAAAGFEIVEAGNYPARARYVVARKR